MSTAVNIALALAILAFVPSAGVFTPAIILSVFAALIGTIAIAFGHVRRGFLTVYMALSSALVSPVLLGLQRVDIWLFVLPAMGAVAALFLLADYNRQIRSSDKA